MGFNEALGHVIANMWARRKCWGDSQVVRRVNGEVWLYDPLTDKLTRAWSPTQGDMMAKDWEIVRNGG